MTDETNDISLSVIQSYTDDRDLTEREAAKLIGFSVGWLRDRRLDGNGPPFKKIGSGRNAPVRYPKGELLNHFKKIELKTSTSQYRAA